MDVGMQIAGQRKAVVTGAASGLGREIARRLAAEGAAVALLDVDATRLAETAGEIGDGALALPTDVRSAAQVRESIDRARATFDGLDTLVACAGVIHVKRVADVTEDDWDRTIDINLKGTFLCAQAAAPALTESGRGRMVFISSDAGRRGSPMLQAYCASKFGIVGLAESLAVELAPAVTVNAVCPVGIPSTGMGQQMLAW